MIIKNLNGDVNNTELGEVGNDGDDPDLHPYLSQVFTRDFDPDLSAAIGDSTVSAELAEPTQSEQGSLPVLFRRHGHASLPFLPRAPALSTRSECNSSSNAPALSVGLGDHLRTPVATSIKTPTMAPLADPSPGTKVKVPAPDSPPSVQNLSTTNLSGPSTVTSLRMGYNISLPCVVCRNIACSPMIFDCSCLKIFAFCARHLDHFKGLGSTAKHAREEQSGEETPEGSGRRTRTKVDHLGPIVHVTLNIAKDNAITSMSTSAFHLPPTPSFSARRPSTVRRTRSLSDISHSFGAPNHQPRSDGSTTSVSADDNGNGTVYFDAVSQPPQELLPNPASPPPSVVQSPRFPGTLPITPPSASPKQSAVELSSPGFSESFELASWTSAQPRSSLSPGLRSDPPVPDLAQHAHHVGNVQVNLEAEASEEANTEDDQQDVYVVYVSDYSDDVSMSSA